MEFNERLQELRKLKGLTQEELANQLYVSRTAISKWESGRGYPSIDSLKAISKYFAISIDELLSSSEALTLAQEDCSQEKRRILNLVFGLLDCSAVLFLFLPFFGQHTEGSVHAVSLLQLTQTAGYLKAVYFIFLIGMIISGIVTLTPGFSVHIRHRLSIAFTLLGTLLFMISRQPYAAVFLFVLLIIKACMYVKQR